MSDENFRIRPATIAQGDPQLLVDCFNSQLDWLPTVGSNKQWTTRLDLEKDPRPEKWVRDSEAIQSQEKPSFSLDYVYAVVAEVRLPSETQDADLLALSTLDESTGVRWVTAGGLVLTARSASYVRDVLEEQNSEDPFLYISFLISDRRTGSVNKGSGALLLKHAREHTLKLGIKRICADCFAGNDRKLVKYYEGQGFKSIGDIEAGTTKWPGAVLETRL